MPNKIIVMKSVTLHVKDEKRSREPTGVDRIGNPIGGKHVVIEVLPGKPVSLDSAEADRLLARHEGEVVTDVKPFAVSPPKEDDLDEDDLEALTAPKGSGKK